MRINFFYESGEIPEIGTGHKYRSMELGFELSRRGHEISYCSENKHDILVIDHMHSQKNIIEQSTEKIVLIDGAEEDAAAVDLSISAFTNIKAQYRGVKYIVFPKTIYSYISKYRPETKKTSVFVALGGFDANNLADLVLSALSDIGLHAIVTKSINHHNLRDKFPNIEVFDEDNYYDAMRECLIGITNGGLSMFQALYFGLPTVALAQYEHQKINISGVQHCCLPAANNIDDIKEKISWLIDSNYYRSDISRLSQHYIDGRGTQRVCALIEGLGE